jgi:phage terminase large subunit-like protein
MASAPLSPADAHLAQSLREARAASVLNDWRLTPATLMAKLNPWWIPAKWLQYLSMEIAKCIYTGNCGLLISAPPRHGKSKLSTVATPLWTLENFPHKNVVVATYGEDLSTDFSREIRDTILNNQEMLNVRLRSDTQRVQNFLTTKGGGLKAVGLRGAITGRGADVFVLDDYIKEPKEAMSPTYLEDLWTWWLTVARTRLEPGAVVIILATRWVADDIHGRIEAAQKRTNRQFFKYIRLPAIYEPLHTQFDAAGNPILDEYGHPKQVPDLEARDVIGRKYGDVLFPERYDKQSILNIREDVTSRWFDAMFQQDPQSESATVIDWKWFRRVTRKAFNERLAEWKKQRTGIKWGRVWDLASTHQAGDYSCGPRCAYIKADDHFYIESMKRGQWSAAKAELEFVRTSEEDYALFPDFQLGMEQEPGSSGKYSVRHFENLTRNGIPDTAFHGIRGAKVTEHPATTSKQLRAEPFAGGAEHGKIWIVVDHEEDLLCEDPNEIRTPWVREFFLECASFPEGAHDDQVDGASLTFIQLTGKKNLKVSIGRKMGKDSTGIPDTMPQNGHDIHQTHRRGATFGRRAGLIKPDRVIRNIHGQPIGRL